MRAMHGLLSLLMMIATATTASAQEGQEAAQPLPSVQPLTAEELEARAAENAKRRAERDASRAQRLPSRPFVLRDPLPLPVKPVRPPGGAPASQSCPPDKNCTFDYVVPPGQVLVVTALWSTMEGKCDEAVLGPTPPNGDAIAPLWHCARLLRLTGTGAGFAGYLHATLGVPGE